MKYSVIIPVYNSEKTIKRCVESIALQNRADVEVIIVNDGSTDDSESLCKSLQRKYGNIIYIYQENGGASSARNSGLSVAKGKYVMFVDSDDYVDSNCFDIIDKHTKGDADFYQFGFSIVKNGVIKETREFSEFSSINSLCKKEAFISNSVVARSINSSAAKLYKRKIIEEKGIRFCKELSAGEDLTFVFTFLLSADNIQRTADKICFIDISNEKSLSRKHRENLSEQLICVYESMCKALEKSEIESESVSRSLVWLYYRYAYSAVNDFLKSNAGLYERRKKLKDICSLFTVKKVTPIGLKCKIIAIPIRLKLVGILDITFRVINKIKGRRS